MGSNASWPVDIKGVVESVTTTQDPDGRWNVAALGLQAGDDHETADPVRARTWGNTRTRRNFERTDQAYVQFIQDPLVFVRAALDEVKTDDPILDEAHAWVAVEVEQVNDGTGDGTDWIDWELSPVQTEVESRTVPVTDRAYGAIIEMTVAASRLDVPAYDQVELLERLEYFEDVVARCGGPRARQATDEIAALTKWESTRDAPENHHNSDHTGETTNPTKTTNTNSSTSTSTNSSTSTSTNSSTSTSTNSSTSTNTNSSTSINTNSSTSTNTTTGITKSSGIDRTTDEEHEGGPPNPTGSTSRNSG